MKFAFCVECAAPYEQITATYYKCTRGHEYWNNPHTCVAVVLIKNDKVLVSKRAGQPRKGTYDLPGGFLEYGEGPLDAAVREIKEETTLHIKKEDLEFLTTFPAMYRDNESIVDIVVQAKQWQGTITPSDDSEELVWKPLEFLDSEEFSAPYTTLRNMLEARV